MPRSKVDEVDLSAPLAGHEGVDPNHASRIRIQTLLDQHASLITQTQFADAKSGGLVTVVGLLALNGPIPMAGMMGQDVVATIAGVLAASCMLFCIFTIFPRYPRKNVREHLSETDRFSWPSLTAPNFDEQAYADFMHTAEVSQLVHSIACSNSAVSHILLRKFQMLRIAFLLGGLDIMVVFARHAGLV